MSYTYGDKNKEFWLIDSLMHYALCESLCYVHEQRGHSCIMHRTWDIRKSTNHSPLFHGKKENKGLWLVHFLMHYVLCFMQESVLPVLESFHTNLHSLINIWIKKIQSYFRLSLWQKYDWIIFFMHMVMRLCKHLMLMQKWMRKTLILTFFNLALSDWWSI